MSNTICPYPGLRPFNEEESIFFKGREQQVERLVKRLEEKKFLMVNGASGDGKSSLIYAGVIPYAKAGFFKAKYNNWIVADFRPERSPLKNITSSICKQLKIQENEKTEKELGYGFSALCDLYKASSFYIDETKAEWINADDKEKKVLKRKGANLLVLVDQFEEFFTNPENYQNGIPSIESQKTVNLLLETYKIAAAQDLPIYVVCTMRSDYIGQCAAFRGLPEAIGYSQFFVPRLKRQEIEQVIEGPAALAGCKISKRLTQTLLNSLTDGFDQLPILQHALHQVWKTANNGADEMDLIHLAKVGGISSKLLNVEDKANYDDWLIKLPDYKIKLLKQPSLSNVLNAHANELYLTAHIIYEQQYKKQISELEAKKIIKIVFQCLTKIDASRAVRNRMTLQEITNIINDDEIGVEKVDELLQVYRQQGNTFLQPFIDEHDENTSLKPSAVLDITHESLIRNWLQLTEWANEEYENLQNYFDFEKQLQRWINANYNKGYLLPIGPLSFFENWFEQLNPSKYWLNRYEEFEGDLEHQLILANNKLIQAKDFIQKSAKRLIFSRTVLKYGAQRIAVAAGIVFLVVLCTYYYFDYRKKQNDYVLKEIIQNGTELFQSTDVDHNTKADFLINRDRLNEFKNQPLVFKELLSSLNDDSAAFDIAYIMFNKCISIADDDSLSYDKNGDYSWALFNYLNEQIKAEIKTKSSEIDTSSHKISLSRINQFIGASAIMLKEPKNKHNDEINRITHEAISTIKKLLIKGLETNKQAKFSAFQFSDCINNLVAIDAQPDYRKFIELLSPLEGNKEAKERFYSFFDKKYFNSISCSSYPAMGGYETVAQLYATHFDNSVAAKQKILALIDSNLVYDNNNQYEPKLIYSALIRHAKFPIDNFDFVLEVFKKSKETHSKIKIDLIGKFVRDFFPLLKKSKVCWLLPDNSHSLLNYFIPESTREKYWDYYFNELQADNVKTDSARLKLAIFYKKRGIYCSEIIGDTKKSNEYFKKAVSLYSQIDSAYQHKTVYMRDGKFDEVGIKAYNYFLYPFIVNDFWDEDRSCSWNALWLYTNGLIKNRYKDFFVNNRQSSFYNYLKKTNNLHLYNGRGEIMSVINHLNFDKDSLNYDLMNLYSRFAPKYYEKMELTNSISEIVPYNIYLTFKQTNDTAKVVKMIQNYLSKFPPDFKVSQLDHSWLVASFKLLAEKGSSQRVIGFINQCFDKEQKSRLCTEIAYDLQKGPGIEHTLTFLNEALKNKSIKSPGLYRLLGKIGGMFIHNFALSQIRKSNEDIIQKAMVNFVLGVAEMGDYYKARSFISESISETNELNVLNLILEVEVLKQNKSVDNNHRSNWNDAQFYMMDITNRNFNVPKNKN